MFHFTRRRIEAHVCICFVALKAYKKLERLLKRSNTSYKRKTPVPTEVAHGGIYPKEGGYLLSRFAGSTIGVSGLNFSVRNGKRWNTAAIATIISD